MTAKTVIVGNEVIYAASTIWSTICSVVSQTASFVALPAVLTPLAEHVVCALHVWLASSAALNLPAAQSSHLAGAALPVVVTAGTNFLPATHFVGAAVTRHNETTFTAAFANEMRWWVR